MTVFNEGDIVQFNGVAARALEVNKIKMRIMGESASHDQCYTCRLVDPSDAGALLSNYHITSFDTSRYQMDVYHGFLELVESAPVLFDAVVFNNLLNTV